MSASHPPLSIAARSTPTIVVAWIAVLITSLLAVAAWENRPGDWSTTQASWPASSSLSRASGSYTLLLFAHPDCPCTLASLDEIERILSKRRDRLDAQCVFSTVDDDANGTRASDGWERAAKVPGLRLVLDPHCAEARRFGARTSGAVVLFDPDGRLLFRGGITGARGHAGDNAGEDAVLALVDHKTAPSMIPVFGCPLFDPDTPGAEPRESSPGPHDQP